MNAADAVALFQKALWMAVLLSAPMLLFGLVAGLIISIFQAVTQIQEMTLSFIPKVLAVVLSLFLFLPWMLNQNDPLRDRDLRADRPGAVSADAAIRAGRGEAAPSGGWGCLAGGPAGGRPDASGG